MTLIKLTKAAEGMNPTVSWSSGSQFEFPAGVTLEVSEDEANWVIEHYPEYVQIVTESASTCTPEDKEQ